MKNSYKTNLYHQMAIQTASREKILLMLYEACIRFFKKCKLAIENKDLPEKGKMLGKSQDIINELNSSLDFKQGGELAEQLQGLYNYISNESTEANIENDPQKIQNCINVLETLYEGWKGAIESMKAQDDFKNKMRDR